VFKLLVFLLVVAGVVLFFHDKQQSADLAKAQADNAQLTQQLSDKDSALNALQLKLQQAQAQAQAQAAAPPAQQAGFSRPNSTPSNAWRFGPTPLDIKPVSGSR